MQVDNTGFVTITPDQTNYVIGAKAADAMPKNYRQFEATHTYQVPEKVSITLVASGQPSVAAFQSLHGLSLAGVHVVSLRQEPHFMVDKGSVTEFKGAENDGGSGLTPAAIILREAELMKCARDESTIYVLNDKVKSKEGNKEIVSFRRRDAIAVEHVESEEESVRALGGHYSRIFVTDNNARSLVMQVDALVNAILHSLKSGHKKIHLHCNQGMGRATMGKLIAVCLIHAKTHTLDEIKGFFNDRSVYKYEQQKMERSMAFFNHFYRYCRENDPGVVSWSDWATREAILAPLLASLSTSKATKNKKRGQAPAQSPT